MVKLAVDQGWTFRAGNRGHHQVIPTNPKKEIVTVCSTPDGPRTIENTRADFRRSGLQGV